ncbi:bifunctional 2',3'-cyclic nucleotide 2'-phosphodiesterase/3'-nucleotidase precursor protein [Paenibacillus sp. FSL R7-269]|uniref:bifunctional 2',3'-cyclic-nucleotide 2'-phosphodiesterase/3'-nucleotidase n=1 Tax=Paenibacillus sp. FSL R7-269 TaxID=1226755 RepID=UPI0003E28590|nr:bifunctional 2',3'-cyclic-nucleotide 2'-phosphodiesterase/3'-nucleotidase [Paenibacillus sp. FSL R7-269]ETT44722.1 bifunctional 2',3'-cyclic nucleotide 2'-phosphodiesterase/3'-nucleotidase precursor protein [Paenibacillus sp. FSL R7-269]
MGERRWNKPIASLLATTVLAAQMLGGVFNVPVLAAGKAEASPVINPGTINLRLMSTTDVHTNVYGWDYFKGAASATVGLDRTSTLVKAARNDAEGKYNLLLDNGDLIQGTPLGTYMAQVSDFKTSEDQIHPIIAAMNLMGYDAATFGNHEFNYGLDYLDRTVKGNVSSATYKESTGAKFPYINANIYNKLDGKNTFEPYQIIDKVVKDSKGNTVTIKVGLLGLVTPQIMEWDKVNLEKNVIAEDIVETAKKFVPEMQKDGADVIVAMTHSGFDAAAAEGTGAENVINLLSKVEGIDAITFSHTHKVFPTNGVDSALDASFKDPSTKKPYNNDVAKVDNVNGHINGTPAVQAGYGGGYLGLIDLKIVPDGTNGWKVDKTASKASTRSIAGAAIDTAIEDLAGTAHQATIDYVNQPLGKTTAPMNSYFAMVQDDPTVQIVTYAQQQYVSNLIHTNDNLAAYRNLPILSVGAPFKAGRNGPDEYTDIKKGNLTIASASDLYLYDNTLKAIVVNGETVKNWVEMSAGAFNRIKPSISTPQPLLNSAFAVFNFDVIDGIKYTIDVTRPAKYKPDGTLVDKSYSRVTSITYNDQPLNLEDKFVVVTNNYRASGGGNFPGVKGANMIIDSQMENRQVLMDYIKEAGTVDPTADNNWSIAPIEGNVTVTFPSSPKAAAVAPANITATGTQDVNKFEIYNLDLKKSAPTPTGDVEVHLLGINDFHGQLDTTSVVNGEAVGTAATLAAYLKEARAKYENSLLFHNGDSVGASAPVSSLERDKPTMEWMNLMKFDIGTLGNHEFDQGVEAMKAQIYGGKDPKNEKVVHNGADFDYINANAVDSTTGKPIITPYVVKEVGGVKIGFIGVVTKATPSKVSPAGTAGVKFLSAGEEVAAIEKYAAELNAQGVKTIVVLAHDPATTKTDPVTQKNVSTGEAVDLAKALPANSPVDVIVAGDNHGYANDTVNGKLIVQAYSYGTAFEDIKLVIDGVTGTVKSKTATVTNTVQSKITPDAETKALVDYYLNQHPELTKPVGTTDGTITRTDAYTKESALGNLIADAMRHAIFKEGEKDPADFAFMNPGGIRADLPKGNVAFGDLAKIQPFGNTLVKLTLTGQQIKTLLQQQWAVKPDGTADTKTLQISGLKYTANMYLPVAERVANLTKADGTPIEMAKSYTAVVNNFMAAGGDNYKVLTEASSSLAGPIDLDVFYEYIVKTFNGGAITAAIEGRIINVEKDPGTVNPNPGNTGPVTTATPKPTASPSATPSPAATPAATAAPTPSPAVPAVAFKDLGKVAWAADAINALAAKGIIKGMDGTNFAPMKSVTRAEFVTMLVRSLELGNSASPAKFSDVKQGVWYSDTIAAAVNAGLVKGSGNGKFEPGREITREEMAIMIANALKGQLQPVDAATLNKFTDKAKIAPYAEQAVAQLTQIGIVNGMDAKHFAPKSMANRAQAAVIIFRMLENKAS